MLLCLFCPTENGPRQFGTSKYVNATPNFCNEKKNSVESDCTKSIFIKTASVLLYMSLCTVVFRKWNVAITENELKVKTQTTN